MDLISHRVKCNIQFDNNNKKVCKLNLILVCSDDDDFDNEECYEIEQASNNQFRTAFHVPR